MLANYVDRVSGLARDLEELDSSSSSTSSMAPSVLLNDWAGLHGSKQTSQPKKPTVGDSLSLSLSRFNPEEENILPLHR